MINSALAPKMGQIADPDYTGAQKTWPQTLKIELNISGLFKPHVGPIFATTVNPSADCYDADPIRGVPEQPRPETSNLYRVI